MPYQNGIKMGSLSSILRLLCLCSLFHGIICDGLEKRAKRETQLFDLTNDSLADRLRENGQILTGSADDPVRDGSINWGTDERRLIAESAGDFALAVQSNVGAWMCVIESKQWATTSKSTHQLETIYADVWTSGCRARLISQMQIWKQMLEGFLLGHMDLEIIGVQAFDLKSATGVPIAYSARKLLIPDAEEITGFKDIPLVGWPFRKLGNRIARFVIQQLPPVKTADGSFTGTVKIYSTGSGPREGATDRKPDWGTYPAYTITLNDGLVAGTCDDPDAVIYDSGSILGYLDTLSTPPQNPPLAVQEYPENPYPFLTVYD